MAVRTKRGATRKPVRKQRQSIAWQQFLRHGFVSFVAIVIVATAIFLQQDDTLPILHVSVEGKSYPVVFSYHPAYILHNEKEKGGSYEREINKWFDTWDSIQNINGIFTKTSCNSHED